MSTGGSSVSNLDVRSFFNSCAFNCIPSFLSSYEIRAREYPEQAYLNEIFCGLEAPNPFAGDDERLVPHLCHPYSFDLIATSMPELS